MHVSNTAALLVHCVNYALLFTSCMFITCDADKKKTQFSMVRLTVVDLSDLDENHIKDYVTLVKFMIVLVFLVVCCGCCQLATCVGLDRIKY